MQATENIQDQDTVVEEGSIQMKTKAEKFQDFLTENNINVFNVETLEDELKSSVFRSHIEVNSQQLPMAVVLDDSVFTIIRTQVVTGITSEKRAKILDYVNMTNEKFKIFKYYLTVDGALYLDICIPFVDATFDSNMIQLMLDVLVKHLSETYATVMQTIWGE